MSLRHRGGVPQATAPKHRAEPWSAQITYLVLSLNTSARSAFVAASRRVLPQLELFPAVSGFDKHATVAALARSRLRYHILTYCSFSRFGTYGSLANYLTKYFALLHQVARRLPFVCMLEDDMRLHAGFDGFVHAQVQARLVGSAPPDVLVLGTWGEGYVTSLRGARRIVHSLQQQGVPQNIDIMLNEGHAGRAERVPGAPWAHRVFVNDGDCLKTPHIRLGELPPPLVYRPRCVGRGGAACRRQRRLGPSA